VKNGETIYYYGPVFSAFLRGGLAKNNKKYKNGREAALFTQYSQKNGFAIL